MREPVVLAEPHAIQASVPGRYARLVLEMNGTSEKRIGAQAQALLPVQDAFLLADSPRSEAPSRFAQRLKGVVHGVHGLLARDSRGPRSVAFLPRGPLFAYAVLHAASQIHSAQLCSCAAQFQFERFLYDQSLLLPDAWLYAPARRRALSAWASWRNGPLSCVPPCVLSLMSAALQSRALGSRFCSVQPPRSEQLWDASHARFLPRWKALFLFARPQRVLRCAP